MRAEPTFGYTMNAIWSSFSIEIYDLQYQKLYWNPKIYHKKNPGTQLQLLNQVNDG